MVGQMLSNWFSFLNVGHNDRAGTAFSKMPGQALALFARTSRLRGLRPRVIFTVFLRKYVRFSSGEGGLKQNETGFGPRGPEKTGLERVCLN